MKILKKYHVIINIFLIVVALLIIGFNLINYKKTKSIEIVRKKIDDKTPISDSVPTIDFPALRKKYKNNDIKAAIRIKNDNFEEIVFQTNNNTYYLKHNYLMKKGNGEIFIDSKLDLDKSKIKVLYGSGSKKSDEFKKYYDEQYYANHKYIMLETEKTVYKYEVMLIHSGYLSYKSFDSNKILKNSLYTYNVDLNDDDEYLIINTTIKKEEVAIVCKKV